MNRAVIARTVSTIRASYRAGQKHNPDASRLIDDCDDLSLLQIAYSVAEAFRLRQCGKPPPARSATCEDLERNLKWAVIDSAGCAPYARERIIAGLDSAEPLDIRAAKVRRGFKIAQSHRQEVMDSIDWVSDKLVIEYAQKTIDAWNVRDLEARGGNGSNPFSRQYCPGLAQRDESQNGSRPKF